MHNVNSDRTSSRTMLVLTSLLVLAGCAASAAMADSRAAAQPAARNDAWIRLFDGSSTDGWRRYNGSGIGAAWRVEDGALHLRASGQPDGWQTRDGGDIVSDREFENFHLSLEWKISPGGNSGVMFYVHEAPQIEYPWQTGIESQVLDKVAGSDANVDKARAGDFYDLLASNANAVVKPAGEWNHLEIISQDGRVIEKINGSTVIDTRLWDDAWRKRIAASKFRDMPGFGSHRRGRIALQDHGNDVWFRDIRVKVLP